MKNLIEVKTDLYGNVVINLDKIILIYDEKVGKARIFLTDNLSMIVNENTSSLRKRIDHILRELKELKNA